MADRGKELLSMTQGYTETPCGCKEKTVSESNYLDVFSSDQMLTPVDMEAEISSALTAIESDTDADYGLLESLSIEEQLVFADIQGGGSLRLEDIVAMAEKYPGLKITFSF